MTDFARTTADAFARGVCVMLVLSRPRGDVPDLPERITVRPVRLREELSYQFTSRTGGRETHENLSPAAAASRVNELFGPAYRHCHLYTTEADYAARVKGGGRVDVKQGPPSRTLENAAHNREKHYLIPEGEPCPFLAEIGVMTPEGRVLKKKYDKFRQINRFLEFVNDVVPALPAAGSAGVSPVLAEAGSAGVSPATEGTLEVVDFGCGKSYLTFALHHLLERIHGRDVHIVGLDWNAGVIRDCRNIAERLGCRGLEFHVGSIADYREASRINLAVSLHACDTATDDAIARAVGWQADAILACPCCQHELFDQVHNDALQPLLRHGILRERFAALATDAVRAQALEICGYQTQVMEFIDLEHTPKNLLLRAVRRREPDPSREEKIAAYHALKQSLGLGSLYLETALGPEFERTVSVSPAGK